MQTDPERLLRPGVAVGLTLYRDGEVLLGQRRGLVVGSGSFGAIHGWLHQGESFADCVRREAWEEAGVRVQGWRYGCVTNVVAYGVHFVGPQVVVTDFEGEPELRQPDMVESWAWYPVASPPEPLFVPCRLVLARLAAGAMPLDIVEYIAEPGGGASATSPR